MTATIQERSASDRRSKSDAPKSQREPYVPAVERTPDDTDYFTSAHYLDQRAAMGDFAGSPGGTTGVLHYLWRNTARNDMPGEVKGWVLSGKCNRAKIATENDLSIATVKRILGWLESNLWIDKLIDPVRGNDMSLRVRMDTASHEARTQLGSHGPDPRVTQTLATGQTDPTIQVFSQGSSQVILEGEEPERGKTGKGQPLGSGRSLGSDRVPGSPARSGAASGQPDSALDRTYFVWQSKGAWHVFSAAKPPKFEARNRQTVTLTPAEDEFYRRYFKGGAEDNGLRAEFLALDPEQRARDIEWVMRQEAHGMEGI